MLLARLFARRNSRSSSRSLGPAHRPAAQRRRPSRPPHVESLEDRTLLSGWAIGVGGQSSDIGRSVAVDVTGNVYVTGEFKSTADFDPGSGTYNLTSAGVGDVFVAKYSTTGALVWARRAGGTDPSSSDTGYGIARDSSGNVYIGAAFLGAADFGSTTLTSGGGNDAFIAKLDNSGNFLWARGVGSTGFDGAFGIAVDLAGNVYGSGGFENTVDFDPGPGTYNLSSAGGRDIFVWMLDASGNILWASRAGSETTNQANAISLDSSGNSYVSGRTTGTADFGTNSVTSAGDRDVFVTKIDPTGNFVWAVAMGGASTDEGYGIAVAASGDIYTTGYFNGTADFDPGPGVFELIGAGYGDAFVSKLDSSGAFVWAVRMGAADGEVGNAITLDSSGNVYTTGHVPALPTGSATVDFDPGPGTAYLTVPASGRHAFVSKLDSTGNFLSARVMGTDHGSGKGIVLDSGGAIYITGDYQGAAYFDIGTSTVNLKSTGDPTCNCNFSQDIFVVKTTQELPTSPQLARLLDSPDPVAKNGTLTLTASSIRVVAGGSNVASVSFYRDKNGNGTLEVGTDIFLGTDTDGSNGWSLTTTAPNKNGITTYFAQAKDSSNVAGNVVSARNRVGPGGPVASMVTSRDRAAASVDLVIDRYYTDDREDRDESSSPSHLSGRSLAELLRTRSHR